jgi:hypothetical protein
LAPTKSSAAPSERSHRFWARLAGLFLVLAVAASGSAVYAWRQLKTSETLLDATLTRATETVNGAVAQAKKYNLSDTAALSLVGKAEGFINDVAEHGRPTAGLCKRRSKNPSLEATEWFGCAGVKIRQLGSLSLIRARARDEGRGAIREGTTCGSD